VVRRAMAVLLAILFVGIAPAARAAGAPAEPAPRAWWFGMSAGINTLISKPDPVQQADSGTTHLAYGFEGGVRLNEDWLLGVALEVGKLGSYPCQEELFCNSIKQEFFSAYALLVFNPGNGPWLFQAGLGEATYDMTQNDDMFGNSVFADTSGIAARIGVGYDWKRAGARTRFGVRGALVFADPGHFSDSEDAAGLGSASFSALLLSFSLSWR
jgi:hypothetical protein